MKKFKLLQKRKKEHNIHNIYHYYIVFYNYIEYIIIIMLQNSLLYKCIFELKQNELFLLLLLKTFQLMILCPHFDIIDVQLK